MNLKIYRIPHNDAKGIIEHPSEDKNMSDKKAGTDEHKTVRSRLSAIKKILDREMFVKKDNPSKKETVHINTDKLVNIGLSCTAFILAAGLAAMLFFGAKIRVAYDDVVRQNADLIEKHEKLRNDYDSLKPEYDMLSSEIDSFDESVEAAKTAEITVKVPDKGAEDNAGQKE